MYKHCNTEESAHRQAQIEQCLLNLMLSTPYGQITISDICDAAEISRKSFYRYFGSKDGCLHALVDHCVLEASGAFPGDSAAGPQHFFERYFEYWKQMHPLLDALCQNHLINVLVERSILCVTSEELEFRNFLRNSSQDDSYEQVLFIVSGITILLINWHLSGYKKSAAQMSATVERLLSRSLPATPRHRKKS